MKIIVSEPVPVPGCESELITARINGDEASIRVWPDGGWELIKSEGDAELVTDWTFIAGLLDILNVAEANRD